MAGRMVNRDFRNNYIQRIRVDTLGLKNNLMSWVTVKNKMAGHGQRLNREPVNTTAP